MQTYISPWPAKATLPDFPRSISILGSTGSIGTSTLKVIEQHPDLFKVTALAGARNAKLLAEQAIKHRPQYLAVLNDEAAAELKSLLPADYKPEILTGPSAYITLAELEEVSVVLSSIVGAAGFEPTLAAAKKGKMIALANKESLVLGGHIIRDECHRTGATILPVDSEHNALFQGLAGHDGEEVSRLILTASGGPFRGKSKEFLETVTREQALAHPNWDMGAKISIDSATLMNKGLEFIEACHLYGLPPEQVDVVVHPQSIIHSLVEYVDGSQLGHLGVPDMQIPIAFCMCFPQRVPLKLKQLNLAEVGTLTFEKPDLEVFPCLKHAADSFSAGQSHPIVLNAANEVAVDLFLKEKIRFLDIPAIIGKALESHAGCDVSEAGAVLELDIKTRRDVMESIV
ncbi:1-deoxy-D-xylulose-5-phosphate reductoisomerase [Maridesulfovibrio salexigens]|uniref:1-deoxy-D-xylulose 5-phosphate reductoisomerase n=1 Tax=Maridesulfovibrio salexigens (strain ATCC 14822 / DSM 2638 / NCIMB 8403 / VKM B-1763) TaxID=526222 RepID=C6C1S0_MARSD|nr:1-deoxy-D-xylulose-5-phosphate reductoisomerase [Maridesulfovibrio salexigens]ACS79316.1 1-deoxy-D-xylulose 5-phosphate reductoisomerase [Maridesulfovibrio salexigens DSM 2638]